MSEPIKKNHRRQVVLVLGMHRSGTSALSGMLSALGAQPPKSLMVPTKDNPKGYWESTVLMRFNDEILASAGSKWNDWDRFNPQWVESAVAENFVERLPGLLEKEYGDASMMLIKDPRICRILPFWIRALKAIDVEIKILIPLRHPSEVAQSMEVRDGYGNSLSYLIWLRNVLEAERASRGTIRSFVQYAELMEDWRGQMNRFSSELGVTWPKWSGMVEAEIERYLSRGLRHAVVEDRPVMGNPQLTQWINCTYQALLRLSGEPKSSATVESQLDEVKHEFDMTCSALAAVAHETEQHSKAAVAAAKSKLEESMRAQASLTEKLLESDRQREAQQTETQAVVQRLKLELEVLGPLTSRVEALEAEKLGLVERHKLEILDMEEKLQARDRKISEIAAKSEMELQDLAESMLQKTKQMQLEKIKLEESLEARFSEIARMTTMLLDVENRVDEKRKLLQLRGREIESLTEKVRAAGKSLEGQRAQHLRNIAAVHAELALAREALIEYRQRIANLLGSRRWRIASLLPGSKLTVHGALDMSRGDISDMDLLASSGLFDRLWYLAKYPDVRKRGMDPVKHYLLHGAREGRDPGPCFSTRGYLARYQDVAVTGINPLLHYLRYGLQEGRENKTSHGTT